MRCHLIRGHPRLVTQPLYGHGSSNTRSPSPFALFSNRHNTNAIRYSSPSSLSNHLFTPQVPEQVDVKLFTNLFLFIRRPATERRGRLPTLSKVSTDLDTLLSQYYKNMLLMIAPRTEQVIVYKNQESPLPLLLLKEEEHNAKNNCAIQGMQQNLLLTIPAQENVTNKEVDLLPIKKRRLRQITEEENNHHQLLPLSSSNSSSNATPNLIFANSSSGTSTSQYKAASASTIKSPLPRRATKIRNSANVNGVTFMDIESQIWWNKAHTAYPFHPRRHNNNNLNNSRPILPPPPPTVPENDEYDQDDPRSYKFRNWIQSFYPEKDFSRVGFGRSGFSGCADESKTLMERLGLINPFDEVQPTQDQNCPGGSLPKFPPWVEPELMDKFDITRINELMPNRRQKFHYD